MLGQRNWWYSKNRLTPASQQLKISSLSDFLKVTTASSSAAKVIFTQMTKNSKTERGEQDRAFIAKHLIFPSHKMHSSLALSISYFITSPHTGLMRM